MAEPHYLSTAKVSAALGVSVTTVKRWVDDGILPAHKTPGGHRRLLLADVLRIVRENQFPHLDLSQLELETTTSEPRALADRLLEGLRAAAPGRCAAVLHGAYEAGMALETLADDVVAPAMTQIGLDWEKGKSDVFQEHQATQLCTAALYELKPRLEEHARTECPLALGGGPEKDPYLLANLLAELVLLDAGWDVINLGPNTPLVSFRKAVRQFRPRLLWVSIGYLAEPETFAEAYPVLYRETLQAGAAVAVGGRALSESLRVRLPYTTFGDGLTHLAAFAQYPCPPGAVGRSAGGRWGRDNQVLLPAYYAGKKEASTQARRASEGTPRLRVGLVRNFVAGVIIMECRVPSSARRPRPRGWTPDCRW